MGKGRGQMTELPYQEVARLVLVVLSVSESKKVQNYVPLPAEHWCVFVKLRKIIPYPDLTVKIESSREE